jgi:mono/diheme cytochrome c family protein
VRRSGLCALLALVLTVSVAGVSTAVAMTKPTAPADGKALYRQFCGKCHALKAALAAGFGSNSGPLAKLGGPSFNDLRVPYSYSVTAVTEPTGGHELVRKKITHAQLNVVATYIAKVTRGNPLPALPTDG